LIAASKSTYYFWIFVTYYLLCFLKISFGLNNDLLISLLSWFLKFYNSFLGVIYNYLYKPKDLEYSVRFKFFKSNICLISEECSCTGRLCNLGHAF